MRFRDRIVAIAPAPSSLDGLAEYEITYECCQCGQLSRSTPATHAPVWCSGCGNGTHRVRWDQTTVKSAAVPADRTS